MTCSPKRLEQLRLEMVLGKCPEVNDCSSVWLSSEQPNEVPDWGDIERAGWGTTSRWGTESTGYGVTRHLKVNAPGPITLVRGKVSKVLSPSEYWSDDEF